MKFRLYARRLIEKFDTQEIFIRDKLCLLKDMNINHLIKLKVNGYTVAKPETIVSPCPVCGFGDVENNFCGMCGHKNEYVTADEVGE